MRNTYSYATVVRVDEAKGYAFGQTNDGEMVHIHPNQRGVPRFYPTDNSASGLFRLSFQLRSLGPDAPRTLPEMGSRVRMLTKHETRGLRAKCWIVDSFWDQECELARRDLMSRSCRVLRAEYQLVDNRWVETSTEYIYWGSIEGLHLQYPLSDTTNCLADETGFVQRTLYEFELWHRDEMIGCEDPRRR